MRDHVLEGRTIEESCSQDVEGIEPTTGLADVLHDEVCRVVAIEPVRILKGIVHLSERHRTRVKPDIEYVLDAAHCGLTRGVIRIRTRQFIDERAVQVRGANAEICF